MHLLVNILSYLIPEQILLIMCICKTVINIIIICFNVVMLQLLLFEASNFKHLTRCVI